MEKSNHGRRSSPPFGSTTLERGSGGGAGHRPSIPGSQTLIGSSSAGDGLNSKKPGAAASASQMLGQWAANNSLIRTMLVSKEAFVRISSFCFAIVLVGFFNIAVAVEDVVNIVNGNAGTSTSSSLGNVQTIVRAAIGIIYFGAMLSVKEIRRSLWIFRCCADPSTPREVAAPSNPEMLGTQLLGKRGSMGSIGAMADGAAGEHGTPAHALEAVVEATAECLESLEEV
ncbi:hypothetical protein M427DRAFT_137507 [Gonapodya prolifera JEL478]|uniref:Uncharacterized protein n=1 Tax=Gonapodya prolifera (strain JEL478) TaxID=1344416 RepID=A0A139A6Z3_GONPJ|nr:hypothetical protein M427DRAFT_137507 [Gonapodya prolifera JEL478]|eukprot:KXS12113.1 hypothetical protein M427DRAFT_137507 [Gonapodya prolifera JEL478]